MKRRRHIAGAVIGAALVAVAVGIVIEMMPGRGVIVPAVPSPESRAVIGDTELGGALGSATPRSTLPAPDGESAIGRNRVFDGHFQTGVALLREGDYRRAIAVFELARRISPHVPEVYVNLGYALMGLEAYDKAAGAFQKAIDLRPQQANAYFGLGESLHELRDERGALGAIRTYLHLTPEDDPFRRDALAALWELEDTVAKLPAVEDELSGVGRQDEAAAHRSDEPRSGQMDPDPPPATSASQ